MRVLEAIVFLLLSSSCAACETPPALSARWRETGMDDGKPLLLALETHEGKIHLRFTKTGEGLWAEGRGELCAQGHAIEARFAPGDLQAGPAASWMLRRMLGGGARFELTPLPGGRLRVSTRGWRSEFAAQPELQ